MTPDSVPDPRLPAAAIFDWDGTLADTMAAILRAERHVMRHLGLDLSIEHLRATYSPDWQSKYRLLGIPEVHWASAASQWEDRMRLARPRAFPHARGALRQLRKRGVKLGLVTASGRRIVAPNLERFNMTAAFDHVVTSNDVTRQKPHPEGLQQALDALGVEPSDAVYVGDTTVDMEMATAAGVPFIAIGGTIPDEVFLAGGAGPVWPSVATWVRARLG